MKIRGLMISAVVGSLTVGLLAGCMDSLAKQVKKDPNSIIGKKTDDIKKFDPNAAKQVVSDSKAHADDPVLYALQIYGPEMEQISKMYVDHAIDLFYAEHDRYPKDHNEFMTQHHQREPDQTPRAAGRREIRLRRSESQAASRQSCRPERHRCPRQVAARISSGRTRLRIRHNPHRRLQRHATPFATRRAYSEKHCDSRVAIEIWRTEG